MVSNKARALIGSDHSQRLGWRAWNHNTATPKLPNIHCPDIAPRTSHGRKKRCCRKTRSAELATTPRPARNSRLSSRGSPRPARKQFGDESPPAPTGTTWGVRARSVEATRHSTAGRLPGQGSHRRTWQPTRPRAGAGTSRRTSSISEGSVPAPVWIAARQSPRCTRRPPLPRPKPTPRAPPRWLPESCRLQPRPAARASRGARAAASETTDAPRSAVPPGTAWRAGDLSPPPRAPNITLRKAALPTEAPRSG